MAWKAGCQAPAGRSMAATSWPALGAQLQASESAAHAFGCALADTLHDGTLMIPAYFVTVGMMQGDTLPQVRANLRKEWLNSWALGAAFRPPAL